jgi:hypothetical protein
MHYRKYEINESFFDIIDTEEKAYILGFIFADGSVGHYKGTFKLAIVQTVQDTEILEKIAGQIYKNPFAIKYYKKKRGKPQGTFYVHNQRLVESLYEYGCVSRKSLILQFPTLLPNNIMPHFIRGYFDGDGCVYVGRRGGQLRISWSVTSSIDFCRGLFSYIITTLAIEPRLALVGKRKRSAVISIETINDTLQILDFMYSNMKTDFYLKRKYEKYQQIKLLLTDKNELMSFLGTDRLRMNRKFSEEEEQFIIKSYVAGKTSYEIGQDLNTLGPTIIKILRRNNIQRRTLGSHVQRDPRSGRFLGK